jgi:hypothetical protein
MTTPDLNPYSPSKVTAEPDPPAIAPGPVSDGATRAQRIAGGVLIANALLVLLETIILKDDPSPGGFSAGRSFIPALIDVGIGGSLLSGNRKLLGWAVVRVALGLVIFAGMSVASKDYYTTVMQVVVSGALLALLLGDAGKPRVVAALSGFGLYAALEVIGVVSILTGHNPIASVVMSLSGDIEPRAAQEVEGIACGYKLTMPNDSWHLRKAEAAKKDNPIVDRWLVRPDQDAHILVIAEELPGQEIPIEAYADTIVENAQKGSADFKLIERDTLAGYAGSGRFLHTTSTVEGMHMEYYYGLVTAGDRAFQVIAFSESKKFGDLQGEFRQVIDSFNLPP